MLSELDAVWRLFFWGPIGVTCSDLEEHQELFTVRNGLRNAWNKLLRGLLFTIKCKRFISSRIRRQYRHGCVWAAQIVAEVVRNYRV